MTSAKRPSHSGVEAWGKHEATSACRGGGGSMRLQAHAGGGQHEVCMRLQVHASGYKCMHEATNACMRLQVYAWGLQGSAGMHEATSAYMRLQVHA
eukprot:366263-Chlamydomonas_euryale.AAC.2